MLCIVNLPSWQDWIEIAPSCAQRGSSGFGQKHLLSGFFRGPAKISGGMAYFQAGIFFTSTSSTKVAYKDLCNNCIKLFLRYSDWIIAVTGLVYLLYYTEAYKEFAGPICASLRPGNSALCKQMSQRWQMVDNTVSDLTGERFQPQTSRSRDECVTARPIGRLTLNQAANINNSKVFGRVWMKFAPRCIVLITLSIHYHYGQFIG